MACLISVGRAINCLDTLGGVDALYISNGVNPYGTITEASNAITNMGGTFVAFKYAVNGAGNSFTTTTTANKDTGTTFFSTVVSLTLPKMTRVDAAQLKLMAHGRNSIIVMDRNLNAFLIGREHGVTVTSISQTSGDSRGDMSGFVIELLAEEKSSPDFINGAVAGNPFAGMSSASPTITVGTNS